MTLRLYRCPHCGNRYPLTLALSGKRIKGHYVNGKECPGSLKPVTHELKGETK